jgi:acylphosphatase
MQQIIKHLQIHGLVQGVGFRWAMVAEARRLGVTGWVRNRRNGDVEAMCSGNDEAVAQLIAWSRRGPSGAIVDRIEIGEGVGYFASFTQIDTV